MPNSRIVGKRFSKVKKTEVDLEELLKTSKVVTVGQSTSERLKGYRELGLLMMNAEMENNFIENQHSIPLGSLKHNFPKDSVFDLGQRLHNHASKALNDRNTIEQRINHAIETGIVYQLIKTYTIESETNKKNKANSESRCESLEEFVMQCVECRMTHQEIWEALNTYSDEEDYYKDGDTLVFTGDSSNLKNISKSHFINKKIAEIKKKFKPTPL